MAKLDQYLTKSYSMSWPKTTPQLSCSVSVFFNRRQWRKQKAVDGERSTIVDRSCRLKPKTDHRSNFDTLGKPGHTVWSRNKVFPDTLLCSEYIYGICRSCLLDVPPYCSIVLKRLRIVKIPLKHADIASCTCRVPEGASFNYTCCFLRTVSVS